MKSLAIGTLFICGKSIPIANSIKNLGINISANLLWDEYVRNLSRKVNGVLFRLRYRSDILSSETKKLLIQSLVFPIIDYCCVLLSNIRDKLNEKINHL